jgi:hypothetical protein
MLPRALPRSLPAVALTAAALAASAGARSSRASGATGASPGAAAASTPAVAWRLAEAGADPLTLDLSAYGSSCLSGQLAASTVESARRIVVTVVSTSASEICTDDYGAHPLTVRLQAPLRGRPVTGPGRLREDPFAGAPAARRVRVPRVTGFARRDAVAVVHQRGLRVRVVPVADLRGLPRTVGQRPASGRSVAPGTTVSLYLSR